MREAMRAGLCFSSLTASAQAPNIHVRARSPSLLRIPELDAPNPAPVPGKVDDTGLAAVLYSISNLKISVFAVLKVNGDSLEFNCAPSNSKLKCAITVAAVYDDPIVIIPPIDMRLPQHFPSAFVAATPIPIVVVAPVLGH